MISDCVCASTQLIAQTNGFLSMRKRKICLQSPNVLSMCVFCVFGIFFFHFYDKVFERVFLPRIDTWDELRALHVDPLGRDTYRRWDSPSRRGT